MEEPLVPCSYDGERHIDMFKCFDQVVVFNVAGNDTFDIARGNELDCLFITMINDVADMDFPIVTRSGKAKNALKNSAARATRGVDEHTDVGGVHKDESTKK